MTIKDYQILLDLPSEKPALEFETLGTAFKDIIEKSDPRFAIGILGGWGSGKTTLMRQIEIQLNTEHAVCVWFNAWRYEREEHLIVPLLDVVRNALNEWASQHPDSEQVAKNTAATVAKVVHSLLAGLSFQVGMPGALKLSYDANKALAAGTGFGSRDKEARIPKSFYHASFEALRRAFEEFAQDDPKRRIVVFVDDLDRCLPEGTLEVLESMKLFFDLPGFVFVVGLDSRVVEWCIDMKYRGPAEVVETGIGTYQIRGADYVKKIFQVPYRLAPVSVQQLNEFLDAVYEESGIPPEQKEELQEYLEPHLRYIVTDAGVNPREIKRYINAYTLIRKVKPDLDKHAILALQTIVFRVDWRLVRDAVYAYRDLFIEAVRRFLDLNETKAVENLNPDFRAIPNSFFEYVSKESKGNALLQVESVDEYIYSGEAAYGRANTMLLDLISKVQIIREGINVLQDNKGDLEQSAWKDMLGNISGFRSHLSEALEGAPTQALIERDLEKLEQDILIMETQLPVNWEDWANEKIDALTRISKTLLNVYQSGGVLHETYASKMDSAAS